MSTDGGGGDNTIEDTPEQRHLAQVAAEKWNFAQQELAPLEDEYMRQVGGMTDPDRMSYLRGRTMQSQQQAASDMREEAAGKLAEGNIDPSSGRYQSTMTGLDLDSAEAGGETMGRAQFEQENQQIQGLQNVVAIGQGQSGQAQQGLANMADVAAADVRNESANRFNRRSANLQLLGQVAGAGTRYGLDEIGADSPGLGIDSGVSQAAIDSSDELYQG
jgi:hypothetical protein